MGQMSEIVFMLVMPFFFSRLGVKWMLLVGMVAWALRYVFFAFGNGGPLIWMIYLGIVAPRHLLRLLLRHRSDLRRQEGADAHPRGGAGLHRVRHATASACSSGRTWPGGSLDQYTYTRDGATLHTWQPIWLIPAVFSAAVLLLFAVFFRYRDDTPPRVTV